jgi:hypothetical protein
MAKQRMGSSEARTAATKPAVARVVADKCQVLYADTVNIALSSSGAALTFYATVPDPATIEHKRLVRYAVAVVQLPLPLAAELPRLLNQNYLEHLDLSQATPEERDVLVRQMQTVADQYLHMAEQARHECKDRAAVPE